MKTVTVGGLLQARRHERKRGGAIGAAPTLPDPLVRQNE